MAIGGGSSSTRDGVIPQTRNRNNGKGFQKTIFSCGHRGLGAFCHRCDRAAVLQVKADQKSTPAAERKALQAEVDRLKAVKP